MKLTEMRIVTKLASSSCILKTEINVIGCVNDLKIFNTTHQKKIKRSTCTIVFAKHINGVHTCRRNSILQNVSV